MLTLKNREKKLYFIVLHLFCRDDKCCIFQHIVAFSVEKRENNL